MTHTCSSLERQSYTHYLQISSLFSLALVFIYLLLFLSEFSKWTMTKCVFVRVCICTTVHLCQCAPHLHPSLTLCLFKPKQWKIDNNLWHWLPHNDPTSILEENVGESGGSRSAVAGFPLSRPDASSQTQGEEMKHACECVKVEWKLASCSFLQSFIQCSCNTTHI